MTALEKAIEAITEQQSKMEKDSTPYFVGEQLMVGIDLANGPDFTAYAKPAQKQTKVSLADFL